MSKNVEAKRFNKLYILKILSIKYNFILQTVKSCFQQLFPWKVWITTLFYTEKCKNPPLKVELRWKIQWKKLKKAFVKAKCVVESWGRRKQ